MEQDHMSEVNEDDEDLEDTSNREAHEVNKDGVADPSDDDEEDEQLEWLLGFVDQPAPPSDLLRHRFPCKVGGLPAWLDPKDIPTAAQLRCGTTGVPLDFLLQVYAPVEEDTGEAFHRTVFLFVSPRGDCLSEPGAVRAFRCQLPRNNPYYGHEVASPSQQTPQPLSQDDAVCTLQRDPWRVLEAEAAPALTSASSAAGWSRTGDPCVPRHVAGIGSFAANRGPKPLPSGVRVYPELELVVEPDETEDDNASTRSNDHGADVDMSGGGGDSTVHTSSSRRAADVERLKREYYARVAAEGDFSEEELQGIGGAGNAAQRQFATFQAAVSRAPEQVLRYCFHEGARPLCPGIVPPPPLPAAVPPCARCGAPRRFEFQVMPQLLNYLDLELEDPQALDWGTIAVYSCSASCPATHANGMAAATAVRAGLSPAYAEEFVFVQPSQ